MDLQPLKIDRGEAPRSTRARRKSRWVTPVVTLAIVGGILWLFRAPILGFVDGLRLPEVQTQRVSKRTPASAAALTGTSANGYIVAKTRAALSADTPGRIVQMNVEEGSVVKKGDVVARLYADEYAAALRRADADLELARMGTERATAEIVVAESDLRRLESVRASIDADQLAHKASADLAVLEFQRAEQLLADGVGTMQRRDQAKADLDAANARVVSGVALVETTKQAAAQSASQLEVAKVAQKEAAARLESAKAGRELAKATLDKTEVRAPFDGIVVLKDAEVGEVVSPNVQGGSNARGSVVTMVDFDSLEVQAEVPETSLSAVKIGSPARIYLDAFPDKPYAGKVDRIWPTANRTKATVEVRISFLERDQQLRPEMGVRVVFAAEGAPAPAAGVVDEKPVVLIPTEALVKTRGQDGASATSVFVVERDTARLREIRVGNERLGKIVVESGLTDGEVIVISPPTSLDDGDRVRLKGGS